MNRHTFTLALCALSSILANYVLSDSPPLDFDYDKLNILLINAYERLPFHIEVHITLYFSLFVRSFIKNLGRDSQSSEQSAIGHFCSVDFTRPSDNRQHN